MEVVALKCPSCGAPISSAECKSCSYCAAAIEFRSGEKDEQQNLEGLWRELLTKMREAQTKGQTPYFFIGFDSTSMNKFMNVLQKLRESSVGFTFSVGGIKINIVNLQQFLLVQEKLSSVGGFYISVKNDDLVGLTIDKEVSQSI